MGLTANVNVKVYPIKEAIIPTESSPCKHKGNKRTWIPLPIEIGTKVS